MVRGGVDSARQTADHSQTGVCQLIGQLLRGFISVMSRPPRADDPYCMVIALLNFTPNVEHNRWRVNFPKRLRILWRTLGDHGSAEIFDTLKLRRKIDDRFPIRDLIDNFLANAFDFTQP